MAGPLRLYDAAVARNKRPKVTSADSFRASFERVEARIREDERRAGRGRARNKTRQSSTFPPELRLPRYKNTLTGLEKHRRLLDVIDELYDPAPTREVLDRVKLAYEEGIGALRMLDVEGVCHCSSGGRSQLLWQRGARPDAWTPPKLADHEDYERIRRFLKRYSASPVSTDAIMREAGFRERDRKQVRGALKALVVRGRVQWSKHNRQAVAWQWVGPDRQGLTYSPPSHTRISINESEHELDRVVFRDWHDEANHA